MFWSDHAVSSLWTVSGQLKIQFVAAATFRKKFSFILSLMILVNSAISFGTGGGRQPESSWDGGGHV